MKLKCKDHVWKAKIDTDAERIKDLSEFMKFYEIKLYNLVLFDYHGEDLFTVKVFKETAVECNYPTMNADEFFRSHRRNQWREEQYIFDCWNLEYDKSRALWTFNAFENYVNYFEIDINKFDIDAKLNNLVSNIFSYVMIAEIAIILIVFVLFWNRG